ncbi:hypothetical protein LU604_23820 [Erwinia tracheiphila]|uniref:Squalene cyclase C-terminal domain-containing protein n=1 Tax=Erwinia tracheiphila TaxID=65700 RepID=A0A345CX05_9GAMM|nr:hypothetical protein [Erwinia tracheiphila]AXF77972.1 hypothetical protein AV903_21320 [Erwinia tracheiphila]UIA83317.1 hypothetical protein LU604_23820 [Erwinia tracheiphila]UIA91933.1 hypothetical protein LU632_23560 [Erwinia tracheiphila]
MHALAENILTELNTLLSDMHDGGYVGPSVYDTAQLLRFHPNPPDRAGIYRWLIKQQHEDGGWGSPDFPLHRQVPTVAAILALHEAQPQPEGAAAALAAAAVYLAQERDLYADTIPDDAPIGAELILPQLCRQAAALFPHLAYPRYGALYEAEAARLGKVESLTAVPSGHPLLHSWESWGRSSTEVTPDVFGSIGISPSATAVWLGRACAENPACLPEHATRYLHNASRATGVGIDGVVPNVWPIDVFEPCWSLYSLHLAGLFSHPALSTVVQNIATNIQAILTPRGLGPALSFASDADDTAIAAAVVQLSGHSLTCYPLHQFEKGDLFVTFPGERNPSLSTTIHAVHALSLLGTTAPDARAYIENSKSADGVWKNEKWHASWLYPTSHAVAALAHGMPSWRDNDVLYKILEAQHLSGGWGAGAAPTQEETAYALFALHVMNDRVNAPLREKLVSAVARAREWLLVRYQSNQLPITPLWIGKELYCPQRVVRVTELAGLWLALNWNPSHSDVSDTRTETPGERI